MNVRFHIRWAAPAVAAAGGFAAFLLRLIQNRTGFESGTGLPIPGSPAAIALVVLLALLCAGLGALCLRAPAEQADRPAAFPFLAENRAFLVLPVAGSFLLALAGMADLMEGLSGKSLLALLRPRARPVIGDLLGAGSVSLSGGALILIGALMVAAALGLLLSCAACIREDAPEGQPAFSGEALLAAPVALVVRLVAVYRVDSVNPVLEDYAVGLLALSFLVLGFYSLAAFAFHAGQLRVLSFCTGCAVVFSLCAMADSPEYLSTPLICAGGSLCLLGFLLLGLWSGGQGE